MKPFCLAAAIYLSVSPALIRASPVEDTVRTWKMRKGPDMNGIFVRLTKDSLVILKEGENTIIPTGNLSPTDLKTALQLERKRKAESIDRIIAMEFIPIPANGITFDMGAPKENKEFQEDEPYHRVKLTRSYCLKTTEVTWEEWNLVRNLAESYQYKDIGPGRNGFNGDSTGDHPVTEVSWWDAVKWCNLKSEIEDKRPVYQLEPGTVLRTGESSIFVDTEANGYRLPTEAEWEYAASREPRVTNEKALEIRHRLNSEGNTHPVSSLKIQSDQRLIGIFGNVAEWCWDRRGPLVPYGHVTDPSGPESGAFRIYRGGSWAEHPYCCRPSYRGQFSPVMPRAVFIGFRPARNASQSGCR